jgi:hypothetical protein
MDRDELVREIIRVGYGRISFPFSKLIPGIFEGWVRLVGEPEEYQAQWLFDVAGKGDPDDGLLVRKAERNPLRNESYDDKYFFHFRPGLWPLLAMRGVDITRYHDWLDWLGQLWMVCKLEMQDVADALDRVVPGYDFRRNFDAAGDLHKLRLLFYSKPVQDVTGESVLASCHTDRDFMTLHVAENYSGLVAESVDGAKALVAAERDLAIVFPGKKAQLMTGGQIVGSEMKRNVPLEGGILRAMPHSVMDTVGRADHRLSVVFFSHTPTVIPGD